MRRGVHYRCPRQRAFGHGRRVAPTTYILPDLPWGVLLEPILQQAPPGATIIVYTTAMRTHVEQALRDAGRGDVIVCQQDAPPAAKWW